MSGLTYTVAPAAFPVTRTQALLFLKQDADTPDDDLVDDLIEMATEQVELITEHQLNDATSIQSFDVWPGGMIFLSRPPLQSVTSVKYRDSAGILQTVAATDYVVNIDNEARGTITFNSDFALPILDVNNCVNRVQVEFVSGYESWPGNTAGVPATLRTALKIFVNEIYEHRLYQTDGAITGQLMQNEKAMQLLGSHRVNTPTAIGLGGLIANVIT